MPANKQTLLDSILAHNKVVKGPQCTIATTLANLPKDDAEALIRVLADPTIRTTAIRRGLAANGINLGDTTIARHRKGECLCGS